MSRTQSPLIMRVGVGLAFVAVVGTSALRANDWQSPGLASQMLTRSTPVAFDTAEPAPAPAGWPALRPALQPGLQPALQPALQPDPQWWQIWLWW